MRASEEPRTEPARKRCLERRLTRQAGAPPLELARIEEVAELLEIARREAAAVLAADPALAAPEHGLLARAAAARGQTMFAGDAG